MHTHDLREAATDFGETVPWTRPRWITGRGSAVGSRSGGPSVGGQCHRSRPGNDEHVRHTEFVKHIWVSTGCVYDDYGRVQQVVDDLVSYSALGRQFISPNHSQSVIEFLDDRHKEQVHQVVATDTFGRIVLTDTGHKEQFA